MESYSVVIIYGPTAVGKSDVAIELAAAVDGVVINADVGQFYTPFSIGTAKPLLPHPSVEHLMFDCCDEPVDVTVVDFRRRVSVLIADILARNKIPIIVGGSGFYISSLFFPPSDLQNISSSNNSSDYVNDRDDNNLWDALHAVDPVRAAKINRHDVYRIKRALSIFYTTGIAPSVYEPVYNPIHESFLFVNLTRDRQELYDRIDSRVEAMMAQGWIQEVRSLKSTAWESFLMRKKLLGYDDIVHFLGKGDYDDQQYAALIDIIARKTRNYAKRQLSFGRMLEKKVRLFCSPLQVSTANLTLLSLPLYIKELTSVVHYSSNE